MKNFLVKIFWILNELIEFTFAFRSTYALKGYLYRKTQKNKRKSKPKAKQISKEEYFKLKSKRLRS